MSAASREPVPVLRPLLPDADRLLPYLRRIDQTRIYSNHGPLWSEFRRKLEGWLSARVGGKEIHIVPTANGTCAIEVALRAKALPGRSLCLMPSYTFIASAHAVCNAGLEPYLLDIEASSLALTPAIVEAALPNLPALPAAVLVISAFGAPPDIDSWAAFEKRHGIPVIFDAAAALASLTSIADQPLAVSLHATKVFGIGEGGAVITTDAALAARMQAMIGFGFAGPERLSSIRGGNFRISEYAAAVGLAVLDVIDAKVVALKQIGQIYAGALAGRASALQSGAGTDWAAMTLNVIVPAADVARTTAALDADSVQWRRWWGFGTHRHPAFADLGHADLHVTNAVAPTVIGVPIFEGLDRARIERICEAFQ